MGINLGNRMKKELFITLISSFFVFFSSLSAQESSSSYNILRMPISPHLTALGGHNITLESSSPAIGWSNPALLAAVEGKDVAINFMTYGAGLKYMGAAYAQALGERHTVAAVAQYLTYGKLQRTDESGIESGTFSPQDLVVGLQYSYLLNDHWSGGATLKMASQHIDTYTSIALAVDAGLNYLDLDKDLSISLAVSNIGAQVKDLYESQSAHLPFNLSAGFSKGMEHMPLRWHATLIDLTRWDSHYYYLPADQDQLSFSRKMLNHLVVGIDLLPTDWCYLSAGYNFRRGYELKSAEQAKLAGISLGAGITLKHLSFEAAYAKYHLGDAALHFSLSYTL